MADTSPVLLGVRHHGPGSARAVRRALEAYDPQIVLIEGPPEADRLVDLAASEQMAPPVALLAYPADPATAARSASFWPYAEFSPEWQAIQWALAQRVPAKFFDLPAALQFGRPRRRSRDEPDAAARERVDPIGMLAEAAGYDDPERWWEDVVEHRLPAPGEDELTAALAPFDAIGAAMAAVRAEAGQLPEAEQAEEDQREAHMRTVLRAALKRHERVAVVCGAWHVPALTAPLPPATVDTRTLKGLSKTKVSMTWVPWTHGRLASWQGYGAGVRSPGWYHHLFTAPDRPVTRWLVDVAGLLRGEGQPVSSAHVIEGVRLAEALATLRGRPLAGLSEVSAATLAVLCEGDELRLHLVDRKMVVGERLGAVPDDTPAVPLVTDVTAAQRRLRIKPSALVADLDLDLRRGIDIDRSHLLHRLRLLEVPWGTPAAEGAARRGKGTFWESWQLAWQPEFTVDLIAASGYGTTVVEAATAKTVERATAATALQAVTDLVSLCLLADLADALPPVLRALEDRAALDTDVVHLMAALPALARTLRYGDVRGTDVSAVRTVTHSLVVRVCVGLPAAVTALDDDAAGQMRDRLDETNSALGLLAEPALTDEWVRALERLAGRDDLHGLVTGRLTRLLFDAGRLDADTVGNRMGLVLTVGVPPAHAAAWVEGFLSGGGLLLVHDERLLSLVDSWLGAIPQDLFIEVLPLLRRTFAGFAGPERRAVGEQVRRIGGPIRSRQAGLDLDHARARRVLPTLDLLLGRDVAPLLAGVPHE